MINMNTKKLSIDIFNCLSPDEILNLYRQGYKLNELSFSTKPYASDNSSERNLEYGFMNGKIIKKMSSCVSSIVQGTTKIFNVTASSGTPPYSVYLIIDGGSPIVLGTILTPKTQSFSHIFNESIGSHTYMIKIIDSCSVSHSSSDQCTINITSSTVPPPPLTGCIECDLTKNYCVANQCIPKNYAIYTGLILAAFTLIK